jgi:hypothetical protein
MSGTPLRLHHELLLLALHDEKGTLAFGQMIEYGLGGAILTELLLDGYLRLSEPAGWRRKQFVEIVRHASGDVAMDAALARIADKRRASPANTVARFAGIRELRRLVATDLARRGILRESERQLLLLFRRRVYPTVDPQPERAVIARVRKALEGTGAVETRTAALIGIASATSSLSAIYKRAELKALRPRIKAIRETNLGSKAAQEAIEAVTAAVIAASVVAAAAGS